MMQIVTTKEYEKAKIAFLHKHEDWKVTTSPMDESGMYYKDYVCVDGAVWNEVNRPVYRNTEVEVNKAKVKVHVKLFETEGWSTDNSTSIYCYEQF